MIRENEGIFFFFLKYDDAFVVRGGEVHGATIPLLLRIRR